jgi:manganese transport system ATP-binding protein
MRKVLMHGPPEVVLQPEHLAVAFGLDVLNRDLPDTDSDDEVPDSVPETTDRTVSNPPGRS